MIDAIFKGFAEESIAIFVLSIVCGVLFYALFKMAAWWREDIRKYNEDIRRMSVSLERITVVLESIDDISRHGSRRSSLNVRGGSDDR